MFHALMLKLGASFVGSWLHAAASGDKGPAIQRFYLWLQGKKTWTGVLLAAVAVALASQGHGDAADYVLLAAGILIPVGLADKAWQTAPASLVQHAWFVFLRDKWPVIASALGTAGVYLTTCSAETAAITAKLHMTCSQALTYLTIFGAVGGWLVGAAALAKAPRGLKLQVFQNGEES
jgi:hypothetical protein